jgi:hypothetical protein
LGASASTTAERSAVSIAVIEVRYSRLNGTLNCPACTAHGVADQRTKASRRPTAAVVAVADSYSTSTR